MNRVDRAWAEYGGRFRTEVLPKLLSSKVFLSIHNDNPDFDVRQATEIGAALLLGKPVLIIVPRGRHLPDGLRRAADSIIEDWDTADPHAQERLAEVLRAWSANR